MMFNVDVKGIAPLLYALRLHAYTITWQPRPSTAVAFYTYAYLRVKIDEVDGPSTSSHLKHVGARPTVIYDEIIQVSPRPFLLCKGEERSGL